MPVPQIVSFLLALSRTGILPVPQAVDFFVERASCPFLIMLEHMILELEVKEI